MSAGPEIGETGPGDLPALEALYPRAFPEEDLLELVRALAETPGVLSLVAREDGRIVGHAMFTPGRARGEAVALLGPLAVTPEAQGRGLGSALVRAGFARLEAAGARRVLVLGDPAYYRRFGFAPERDVAPPHALPEDWRDAWQGRALAGDAPAPRGPLELPAPWMRPELWLP
ncbi:MAG: GNAT family N-acetyltransferase [Pseudomonadota bacterium]